jgi:UDP-N-acetylglucosamine 1-carboxyvinyltransferase
MSALLVTGGRRLEGQARVQGAKNSVLPILAAAILAKDVCVLHNCPRLRDVDASLRILRHLGCQVERRGDTLLVDSRGLSQGEIPHELMREMRSSVIFLGAILARVGEAKLSMPGGCELGPRPIDLHLLALRTMGAEITQSGGDLTATIGRGLHGCHITLSIPSVGATENAMLAAVAAQGPVTIENAAREPEIVELGLFLREMGARLWGEGTSTLVVEGGAPLHGCEHTIRPDRIVAATWMAAIAAAGGEGELTPLIPDQVSPITALLRQAGCRITVGENSLVIRRGEDTPLTAVSPVRTGPYPGFPTDAQPPLMGAMTLAKGSTIFVETMFESRYRHVDELRRMGAEIRVADRVAVVTGRPVLSAAAVEAADLRGGAALIVAALGAQGESRITGLPHIDRGYDGLEALLTGLGAQVRRVED